MNNEQLHGTTTIPLTSHNMAYLVGERANYSVKLTQYQDIDEEMSHDKLEEVLQMNILNNREEYKDKNESLRRVVVASKKSRQYYDHTNMASISKTIGGSFKLGRIYSYAGVCSIESLAMILHKVPVSRIRYIQDALLRALNHCMNSLDAEVRHLQMLYPALGIQNDNYLLGPFLDEPVIRIVQQPSDNL